LRSDRAIRQLPPAAQSAGRDFASRRWALAATNIAEGKYGSAYEILDQIAAQVRMRNQ
jgi:hypothetical protein